MKLCGLVFIAVCLSFSSAIQCPVPPRFWCNDVTIAKRCGVSILPSGFEMGKFLANLMLQYLSIESSCLNKLFCVKNITLCIDT